MEKKKCSIPSCSHLFSIDDRRQMCERCRKTQAEQSKKKRERKRKKEDDEGKNIKRRALSKPKPPLYRIPNVGLFTERHWEHLDRRLFKFPDVVIRDVDEDQDLPTKPRLVARKDGYVRNPPPAKDAGAKELVAVKICNIKSCYQPVPIDHKRACADCHSRSTAYIRRRDGSVILRKRRHSSNQTLPQPSLTQPSDISPYQNPSLAETANEVPNQTQPIEVPPVPTTLPPQASSDEVFTLSLPNFSAPTPHPISQTAPSAEVGYQTRSANASVTQTPLCPFSPSEGAFTDQITELSGVFVGPSDEPHQNVSFERHRAPIAKEGEEPIIISPSDEDEDVNLNQYRHRLVPLVIACVNGHEAAVNPLLDQGVDINAYRDWYGYEYNALQAASHYGHKSIVRTLLDRGAEVNSHGGYYGSALQAACLSGVESLVTLLIEQEADINAQGGEYGNALQAACFLGQVSVINLLLDRGADVNAQGGLFGNALQAAAYCGRKASVKLLLDKGADVNAQGGQFGNALQAACWMNRTSVVELLLDHGADVHAQGGEHGDAFRAARINRVRELLLSRGAIDRNVSRDLSASELLDSHLYNMLQ